MRRFLSKIIKDPQTGCWLWTGCKDKRGYGRFSVKGKNTLAHIYSYETFSGLKPTQYLQHTCGINHCVNPAHLYEGKNIGRPPEGV